MSNLVISDLPHLNVVLNLSTVVLLVTGYYFTRKQNYTAHKICMSSALFLSIIFLSSYVIYHLQIGKVPFAGVGIIRDVYFSILASHVVLAIVNLPLVLAVVMYAATGQMRRHRNLARWVLFLWGYVSITGVIIYLLVFHLY